MTEDRTAFDVLGPLERRVMDQLWAGGPQSVGEVLETLNSGSERRLAYTTVMTILVRLFEKGYLTRTKEGRYFRYEAAIDRDEASVQAQAGRRELSRLIDRYGAESVAGFATDIAAPDLAERLRALATKHRGKP